MSRALTATSSTRKPASRRRRVKAASGAADQMAREIAAALGPDADRELRDLLRKLVGS